MERQWKEVQTGPPPHGNRVALRLMDAKEDITYGIGYYSRHEGSQGWNITAREDPSANLIVAWACLPES
jgi:hypothetical protein